jgi:hypothetical protein
MIEPLFPRMPDQPEIATTDQGLAAWPASPDFRAIQIDANEFMRRRRYGGALRGADGSLG